MVKFCIFSSNWNWSAKEPGQIPQLFQINHKFWWALKTYSNIEKCKLHPITELMSKTKLNGPTFYRKLYTTFTSVPPVGINSSYM
jgi:hypothetical protein